MIPHPVLHHFKTVDPVLYHAASILQQEVVIKPRTDYFAALCESIINQQISTKAGDAIWSRFRILFTRQIVTPEQTLAFAPEQLRSIGLSNAKAKYILDLASKVATKEIHLEQLITMTNDQIIAELTQVKGIGTWTVEMFLMFTLGREDIFSVKDLGLKRGIQKLYHLDQDLNMNELETISLRWSPYRTYASLILWKSL